MKSDDENELLISIAEGDEEAFASFYSSYAPRLKAYAWKFTRSREDTEEIIQESFLQVWLHRDKLPGLDHVQAWIYKITARCCLQWIRRQTGENNRVARLAAFNAALVLPTPADFVQWQELKTVVETAINSLPPIRQEIYRINREEGLKPAAIAIRLDMPVGTVKNHLSQAIRSIRDQLLAFGYPVETLIVLLFWLL